MSSNKCWLNNSHSISNPIYLTAKSELRKEKSYKWLMTAHYDSFTLILLIVNWSFNWKSIFPYDHERLSMGSSNVAWQQIRFFSVSLYNIQMSYLTGSSFLINISPLSFSQQESVVRGFKGANVMGCTRTLKKNSNKLIWMCRKE